VETEARHVLVGTATVIFAGAVLATVVWLAGLDVARDRDRFLVYFEDAVSGLEAGGAVRMNGVRVGSVERIRLRPDRPDSVAVTVEVRSDAPIAEGSVARLKPRGVTGAQFVSVTAAEPDAAALPPGSAGLPVIPSERSTLSRLMDRAPRILDDIAGATERIGALVGGEGDGRADLVASLTETSGAVRAAAERVADLAEEGRDTLDRAETTLAAADEALAAARAALAQAESTLAAAGTTFEGTGGVVSEGLPQLVADAREAAEALSAAAGAAERLIRRNDAPVGRFANQGLAEVRHLVNEARLMVDALTQVAEMLQRDPNAVIFGPGEGEFRPETRQ
jgi:phospholipid/cholesterol/gamma-HCH transport system substrate-binding protein